MASNNRLRCIDCPETFAALDAWARHDRMESALRHAANHSRTVPNREQKSCDQCGRFPDAYRYTSVLRLNVEYRAFFTISTCSERCEAAWIRAYHASMPTFSAETDANV